MMLLRDGSFRCILNLSTAAAAAACLCFPLRALDRTLSDSTYLCDVRFLDNCCDMQYPLLSSAIFPSAAGAESLFCAGQYCRGSRANATGDDDGSGCAVGTDASQPG